MWRTQSDLLTTSLVITGRNEVVAKVIFLHLFVILFTGGVLSQCMLGYHPPPGSRHLPLGADTTPGSRHPPPGADTTTPQSRHPLGADITTPPPGSRHRPGADPPSRHPPDQAPPLGSRLLHPTGMHSCLRHLNVSLPHCGKEMFS